MLSVKTRRKCAKCGHSSKDSNRSFHRFPKPDGRNIDRARKWAVWAYPNENWDDEAALVASYKKSRVICSAHFKSDSFTEHAGRNLHLNAFPEDIDDCLGNEDLTSQTLEITPDYASESMEPVPQTSTSENTAEFSTHFTEPLCTPSIKQKLTPRSILREMKATRVSHLTPREQFLHRCWKKQAREIQRLRKKHKKSTGKAVSDDLSSSSQINKFSKQMTPAAATFFKAQLRVSDKKPKGRRWMLDEKLLALTIFKKSPSGYRFLRKLFLLPSPSTSNNILSSFCLRPGISDDVLRTIAKSVESMAKGDEVCAIMFDEMSIKKHLSYNQKEDIIDGYQDHGTQGRSPEIASYAIVFMVTGLRKHWKQPVAHYFSASAISSTRLRLLLIEVIQKLLSINSKVVASISDMGTNNVACYKHLRKNEEDCFYTVNGEEVAIIYDYPHLLKCFRNMSQAHNLSCIIMAELNNQENVLSIAKWEHLVKSYEVDSSKVLCRRVPKLTKAHIDPQFSQKMRVCYAAQTSSHSSGVGILSYMSGNQITSEALATASICMEIDNLFDSLNGSTAHIEGGKFLRTRITNKSAHLQFWAQQKERIRSWKFDNSNPPSVSGWLATLNVPRRSNQDASENLYGVLRALCGGNRNPTVPQFEGALKTAIINSIAIHDAKTMNCEADDNSFLCNLRTLLNKTSFDGEGEGSKGEDEDNDDLFQILRKEMLDGRKKKNEEMGRTFSQGNTDILSVAYVAGFIIRRLSKQRSCDICLALLTSSADEIFNEFINYKEYNENGVSSTRPSFEVAISVGNCATLVDEYLDKKAHLPKVKANIIACSQKEIDFTWLSSCQVHFDINVSCIIKSTCAIWLKWWLTRKNREFAEEKKSRSQANRRKYKNLSHL